MQTPILRRLIWIFALVIALPALAGRSITVNQVSNCSQFTDLGTALVILHNLSSANQTVTIKGGMKYMVGNDTVWGPQLGLTVGNYMAGWEIRGHDANASVISNGQTRTYPTGSLLGRGSFCQGTNFDSVNGPQVLLKAGGTVLLQTSRHGCGAHVSFDLTIAIAEDRGAVEGSATFGCYAIDLPTGAAQLATQTSTAYAINGGRPF